MMAQILHAYQPADLKLFKMDRDFASIGLVDIHFGSEALEITLKNKHQILKIIYDQIDLLAHTDYYVQNFPHGTESSIRIDLPDMPEPIPVLNPEAYYMFKVKNSEFIEWNDRVSAFKSTDYHRKIELHLFLTSDDIIETLSIFEPKFMVKDK